MAKETTPKEPKMSKTTKSGSEAPKPKTHVNIRNQMLQKLAFNIPNADGEYKGVELEARGTIRWPKLDDYGPYVDQLRRQQKLMILV